MGTGRRSQLNERLRERPAAWVAFLRAHLRLFISITVAGALYLVTPGLGNPLRFLVAWDAGIVLWLVLITTLILRATADDVRRRAAAEDPGGPGILLVAVLATLFSLVSVIQEAGVKSGTTTQAVDIALAVGTLVLSWMFMHTIYAMHYAREYYSGSADVDPMLNFPGGADPDFWDFIYFAFNIGTASQTADISVPSRHMRRILIGHQVVSYLFNTAVLALGVNVAAGLV